MAPTQTTPARLVPIPRLISVARLVKVPFVSTGIIARSIGTRRGSRRHARFLALRLRSRRRIGPGRYAIVERLSRKRLRHCGSLGKRGSTGRTLQCRGRGKLAWLRMDRRPGRGPWWSFLFSGILRLRRRFDLPRLSGLLRRDRRVRCHWPPGVWRHQGARCNRLFPTGRSSNENTVAAPTVAPRWPRPRPSAPCA